MTGSRVPQLYGLRALSISYVLVTHLWTYPANYVFLNRLAAAGWMGVQLSFVLSGFLITKILWRSREDDRYYVNFYARRALRIIPLYYLLLTLVFFVAPLFTTLPAGLERTEWMYWTYLSNFAIAGGGWQLFLTDITWSLAIEEQFYVVWPAIVARLSRGNMVKFCLFLVAATPLARALLWSEDTWMWTHMLMPLRADAFALGALLALTPLEKLQRYALPVFAVGAAVLATLILGGDFARNSALAGTIGYSIVGVTAAAALLVAMNVRALSAAPLVHMGTVSYGIYLYHPLCLMTISMALSAYGWDFNDSLWGSIARVLTVSAATIAVATLSYRLYESPVLKLKRFFESSRTVRVPPTDGKRQES